MWSGRLRLTGRWCRGCGGSFRWGADLGGFRDLGGFPFSAIFCCFGLGGRPHSNPPPEGEGIFLVSVGLWGGGFGVALVALDGDTGLGLGGCPHLGPPMKGGFFGFGWVWLRFWGWAAGALHSSFDKLRMNGARLGWYEVWLGWMVLGWDVWG